MDFRNYDATIGRFMSPDRLSEFVPMYTPYRFGLNNPVYWNDPTGLIEFTYDKNGNTTGYSTNDQNEIQAIMQFLGSNEKASTSDIENFVWTDMDSNENSVFSLGLGEVSVKSSPDYAKMLRKTSGYLFKLNQPFEEAFKRATTYTEIPSPWARTMVYYEKTIPKWIPQIGGTKLRSPSILVNSNKVGKIAKGLKVGGVALGAAGAVLGAVDIYENGLNTSNGLDTTMSILAATPTGWTQAIAGTYFLTNFIVTATTGQDIGQHIESMINEN